MCPALQLGYCGIRSTLVPARRRVFAVFFLAARFFFDVFFAVLPRLPVLLFLLVLRFVAMCFSFGLVRNDYYTPA